MLTDQWSNEITLKTADGVDSYTRGGVTISYPEGTDTARVLNAFNGMHDGDIAPVITIPSVITSLQAKVRLSEMSSQKSSASLYDDVSAMATAAGGRTLIAWTDSTDVPRDSQLVQQIATSLGWTDADLDAFFSTAAVIQL